MNLDKDENRRYIICMCYYTFNSHFFYLYCIFNHFNNGGNETTSFWKWYTIKIKKQNLIIKELQAKVNISLFDDTKSFKELESIADNLKTFNSMKLAIKCLRKQLKDNRSTIADLVYKLTQAKLKIKQLTGE